MSNFLGFESRVMGRLTSYDGEFTDFHIPFLLRSVLESEVAAQPGFSQWEDMLPPSDPCSLSSSLGFGIFASRLFDRRLVCTWLFAVTTHFKVLCALLPSWRVRNVEYRATVLLIGIWSCSHRRVELVPLVELGVRVSLEVTVSASLSHQRFIICF